MTERDEIKNQQEPFIVGSGAPVNDVTGTDGQMYYDHTGQNLYGPRKNGIWPGPYSLVGATGPTGPTGASGASVPAGVVASNGTLAAGAVGITSVSEGSTGVYTITFSTPFANTNYIPIVTLDAPTGYTWSAVNTSTTVLTVSTFNASAAATAAAFNFAVQGA